MFTFPKALNQIITFWHLQNGSACCEASCSSLMEVNKIGNTILKMDPHLVLGTIYAFLLFCFRIWTIPHSFQGLQQKNQPQTGFVLLPPCFCPSQKLVHITKCYPDMANMCRKNIFKLAHHYMDITGTFPFELIIKGLHHISRPSRKFLRIGTDQASFFRLRWLNEAFLYLLLLVKYWDPCKHSYC